jgi:hypothetical protein
MRAAIATQAGVQVTAHEDWAGVLVPGLAVVLDGLSAPDGTGTGCRHGTPWYVSQLGPRLLALAADPSRSLADALAEAVDPEGRQWPRTKRSDDATAVHVVLS